MLKRVPFVITPMYDNFDLLIYLQYKNLLENFPRQNKTRLEQPFEDPTQLTLFPSATMRDLWWGCRRLRMSIILQNASVAWHAQNPSLHQL